MGGILDKPEPFLGGGAPPPPSRRRFATAALAVAVAGWVSGCARHTPADLVIVNGAEPESLDPAIMTGLTDLRSGGAVFEGLTRYRATDGAAEPGLAASWDISPDGLRYRFHLRPEATWSTGEPLTARDLEYSWRRILDPATGCDYAAVLFYVRGAEAFQRGELRDPAGLGFRASGPHEFEVELLNPTPFFLDLCALPTLAAVPRQAIERYGERWLITAPVPASGAYQLEYWRVNDRIRLRRNPRYWDDAHTRSTVVDLLPCTNPNTALNLFETGAADLVWDKNLVPVDLLDLLLQRPEFHTFPVLSTFFLRFNVTRPPFQDARVRRAFGHAVDRERVIRKITRGGERATTALTPPLIPGYEPPEGLRFDPALAQRLLAEAGFPGGQGFPRVEFLFDTTTRVQERIFTELQEMWRSTLGVEVAARPIEWKTFLRAQRDLDYQICRSSWVGDYLDPTTFLDLFLSGNGNNRTGWTNAVYDRVLAAAAAATNAPDRWRLLQQAETLLVAQEAPIVPIYIYSGLVYFDPNALEGWYGNSRSEHPVRSIGRKAPR